MGILGYNEVIRYIIIMLVQWVSYKTHSITNREISLFVFFAYFYNTGLLILLVHGSNHEFGLGAIGLTKYSSGEYSDFSTQWYE